MTRIQPLAYVAVEVRVPFMPRLAKSDVVEELGSGIPALGVVRPEKRQRAIQEGNELRVDLEEGWRFSDLSMTRSLIVTPTSVIYETTHYPGFESFSADFEVCLRVVTETARPVGYDRVGLRYVNEVWPPFPIEQFTDWARWVAPDLISALVGSESAMSAGEVPGIEPRLAFGEAVLNYKLPENCALTLKVAMRQGEGVVGDAPLRRRERVAEPGPFFVVDFDGYWPRKSGEVRIFDESQITTLLRTVHSPVKAGFRWTTTPEFISEVGVKDVFN
jgi:uncharacterized protein (TIGR04255 family)